MPRSQKGSTAFSACSPVRHKQKRACWLISREPRLLHTLMSTFQSSQPHSQAWLSSASSQNHWGSLVCLPLGHWPYFTAWLRWNTASGVQRRLANLDCVGHIFTTRNGCVDQHNGMRVQRMARCCASLRRSTCIRGGIHLLHRHWSFISNHGIAADNTRTAREDLPCVG